MFCLHQDQRDSLLVYLLMIYKKNLINKVHQKGIEKIGQMAINLANYEGLHAHALSVSKG